jgi:3-hydroxyacyl-[acyl-carrier-protein] dehydratase
MNNDIFSIIKLEKNEGQVTAVIGVNKNAEIFSCHFPGQPIAPGACTLQMLKDVLETALNTGLQLKKADNLKFINMIVPEYAELLLNITYLAGDGQISVTAKLTNADVTFFKFQGSFCKI